jgi:hypothetical protein
VPTAADPNLLDRQSSVDRCSEAAPTAAPLLREIVNYGSRVLAECTSRSRPGDKTIAAPLALYHHILELTDSTEVLVSSACVEPAAVLLRSSFEALLSLQHIIRVTEPALFEQRSLAWLATALQAQIRQNEELLPETPLGREFRKALEEDEVGSGFSFPPVQKVEAEIAGIRKYLDTDEIRETAVQCAQPKFRDHWYRMNGGPSNVRDLARRLHRLAEYDILYVQWSAKVHAADVSALVTGGASGPGGTRPLRSTDQIALTTTLSSTFLLYATHLLTLMFGLQQDYATWYVSEVADDFLALAQHSGAPWQRQ